MKKNYFLLVLLFPVLNYAQVGVNTEDPKTTLDVSATRNSSQTLTDLNKTYGLQAPRLTRAELQSLTSTYGDNQKGAILYITDISGGTMTGQRIKIDAVGYYYFDGAIWQKISGGDSTYTEPWQVYGTNTLATSNTQNIYQMGRIGIGTTTPERGLSIVGDGNASDDILIESFTTSANSAAQVTQHRSRGTKAVPASVQNSDNLGSVIFGGHNGTVIKENAKIDAIVNGAVSASSMPIDLRFTTGDSTPSERMRITSNGNIGIGTTSPQNKLEITHGTEGNSGLRLTNLKNAEVVGTDSSGNIILKTLPTAKTEPWRVSGTTNEATSNTENIYQMGRIGIGTNSPGRGLSIVGDGNAGDDILIESYTSSANSSGQVAQHRARGSKETPTAILNGDNLGSLTFGGYNSGEIKEYAKIDAVVNGTVNASNTPIDLKFSTGTSSAVERLRISSTGNVGIGTNAPSALLHVNGKTRITDLPTAVVSDEVVMADSSGNLKKINSKTFLDNVDQTVNFGTAGSTGAVVHLNSSFNNDVIWSGFANNIIFFYEPSDEQIRKGRIIHIVAAHSGVYFQGTRPTISNNTTMTGLAGGHRISVVPVNAYGGKAWYVISASGTYDQIIF